MTIAGVTIRVFYTAYRSNYVSMAPVVSSVITAMTITALREMTRPLDITEYANVYPIGLAMLVVLPIAGMPVAFAASRRG